MTTVRNELMPVNKIYNLETLLNACEEYIKKTGRRITFEYVLIQDVNDSDKDAFQLSEIAKRLKADVNLIPCSVIPGKKFPRPEQQRINSFLKVLSSEGVNVTTRNSKGSTISAACGQLAGSGSGEKREI